MQISKKIYGRSRYFSTVRTNSAFHILAVLSLTGTHIAAPYNVWLRFQYTRSISSIRWRPCFMHSVSPMACRTASYRRCSLSVGGQRPHRLNRTAGRRYDRRMRRRPVCKACRPRFPPWRHSAGYDRMMRFVYSHQSSRFVIFFPPLSIFSHCFFRYSSIN